MNEKRAKLIPAVYLLLIRKEKILLLRRFNTGFEDGKYCLVAGHVKENEKIKQAIIRETREEIGIEILPENVQLFHVMRRRSDSERIDFFFECKKWEGEPKIEEPEKCDDLSWFPIDDLSPNAIPYIRTAIKNYRNNIFFSDLI